MKRQFEKETKAPFAGIHGHFAYLTGDYEKAILLDVLIYQAKFGETAMEHLQEQLVDGSLQLDDARFEELYGWVTKPISWYLRKYLVLSTQPTVSRKLNELVTSGLLEARDGKAGMAVAYRPRMTVIKKRLAELGYTLDGSIIRELVDGVEEHFANPPKPDQDRTSEEQWDAIPGKPKTPKVEPTVADKNAKIEEHTWVAKCRLLEYAPPIIQHFSWLVYRETGHTPDQHKRTWLSDLEALNKASGSDESIFLAGLQAGEQAKKTGMVLKGPRSYLGYIQNARATANKPQLKGEPLRVGVTAQKNGNNKVAAISVGMRRKV